MMIRLAAILLLAASTAHAHPGGLDSKGCHRTSKEFKYVGGRVLEKGDHHCHRKMKANEGLTLDGKERLQDDKESKERKGKTK